MDIYEAKQKKMGGKDFVKEFGRMSAITDHFFAFDSDEAAILIRKNVKEFNIILSNWTWLLLGTFFLMR